MSLENNLDNGDSNSRLSLLGSLAGFSSGFVLGFVANNNLRASYIGLFALPSTIILEDLTNRLAKNNSHYYLSSSASFMLGVGTSLGLRYFTSV